VEEKTMMSPVPEIGDAIVPPTGYRFVVVNIVHVYPSGLVDFTAVDDAGKPCNFTNTESYRIEGK
jgi:hypothetical protein